MIVGPTAFVEKTRWFRKAFGGGVRQAGPMAAAADYGLTHHFPRLASTHALARRLADGLTEIGCELICPTETNMVSRIHIYERLDLVASIGADAHSQVFFSPAPLGLTIDAVIARMQALPNPISFMRERVVVHHQISPQAIEDFLTTMREMKEEVQAGGGPRLRQDGEQLDEGVKMKKEGELRIKAATGY